MTFTARIAHKLLQRSDPLNLLIKNYEERQDDMMKDQRKIFRDQMAYLHRKTLEGVGADTKKMAAVMRETLDKAEKELITLRSENKSLKLKHTLLSTEHAVMKAKYSSHGNESGDPLAQCQRDLVDWQNRYSAKDNEAKMLATQLGVLTNVIQTQGLNLIPSAPAPVPVSAPAPTHIAPSVNNDDIRLDGWDFGGTRQPAWGNTRPAAVNREPDNNGWVPLLLRLSRMKVRTRTQLQMTLKEWIMSPVMGNNRTPRANPKEKGNINPLTMESVEEILMKIWEEKYAKERNGTVMVRLLP
jgi:hypothetical protein